MKQKAIIKYLLSLEGRRQCILNGGDGRTLQTIKCNINKKILKLADVHDNGYVEVNIGFFDHKCDRYGVQIGFKIDNDRLRIYDIKEIIHFDKEMTVEELLIWEENRLENLEKQYYKLKPELNEMIKKNYFCDYNTATKEVRNGVSRGFCLNAMPGNKLIDDYQNISL